MKKRAKKRIRQQPCGKQIPPFFHFQCHLSHRGLKEEMTDNSLFNYMRVSAAKVFQVCLFFLLLLQCGNLNAFFLSENTTESSTSSFFNVEGNTIVFYTLEKQVLQYSSLTVDGITIVNH